MILELPAAKVNKCANLGKRVWEFRWDQSLSTELMESLLNPEGSSNGYLKGVLNARIHLNPEAAESVWAALIPTEQTGANDSCAADRMGLELAPADQLPVHNVQGRFTRARRCSFVDFTEHLREPNVHEKIILKEMWPLLLVEFKRVLTDRQVR